MKKTLLSVFLTATVLLATGCAESAKNFKSAKDWESEHPNILASYQDNAEMEETTYGGSVQVDYLEKYPYLNDMYEGFGFSVEYLRARGHVYAMEDVIHTERPKPGASCLACKTTEFLIHLEENGVEGNATKFEDVASMDMETISCYDCHRNEPGTINITRGHLETALEGIGYGFDNKELACAQCHVEYYQEPENKEVVMPSVNGLDPDSMLAYYDDLEYSDWIHPRTGSPLLKVQHPEWETFQGSIHQGQGLSCIDCHMPPETDDDGTSFRSHHWTSPLKTIETSCLSCHSTDTAESLTARVVELQGGVEEVMNETGYLIVDLIDALEAATNNGVNEDILTKAREKHRQAQWYLDFVFVENSEGFHNNALTKSMLAKAKTFAEEGLELLK